MKKPLKSFVYLALAGVLSLGMFACASCGGNESQSAGNESEKNGQSVIDSENSVSITDSTETSAPEKDYTESDVYGNEYIKYHTDGQTVEYVFEAECTNLENKYGNTYSGNAAGSNMAKYGGVNASNNGVVGYLYNYGNSVNFVIVSDREVEEATLVLRCGAEFNNTTINANTVTCRVDPVTEPEAFLTYYQNGGAWGKWDEYFLDYYKLDYDDMDNYNFRGYHYTTWDCGSISIEADGVMDVTGISDYVITSRLHIYKGITSISFVTNNNDVPKNTETQRATAVVIDCIKIITDAQLGMYNPQNNNYGTENACTYMVYED